MEQVTRIELASPAWKAGTLTIMLHLHNCTAWHSIIKLNHFIASPRLISLYYIMYLFISCLTLNLYYNLSISQGLPYVKTFLIPYVNQSGLSHCPITFSTFRLLNANKRTSIEDIKLTLFIIKYGDTYITNYLCVSIHI